MIWIAAGLLALLAAAYFLVPRPARLRTAPAKRPEAAMVLREEQVQLRKTREQLAEVTAHTEVLRSTKTITVPVTREELVVEKDGVEAMRIPLREEQVDVSTRSVLLNEVSLYRREWEENKEIEATLKKEVARVETTGDATCSEGNAERKV